VAQRRGATAEELSAAACDVNVGMLFSNVVMYFIILSSAATLGRSGRSDIQSAAEAAEALRPLAGDAATILMAVGLIGTGFLAVPILTGASAYAVCEAFGWRCGLDQRPSRAKRFYAVIVGSTLVGLVLNLVGVSPMAALYWTAVLNGVLAPPLLVIIMLIANNRAVLGPRVNGRALNVLGWAATGLMAAAVVGLFATGGG
jgi:Mn2+/Fe2+ NRAMP family transporter